MPIRVSRTEGGSTYGQPFIGPITHTATVPFTASNLTAAEIDVHGYVKPGVPLKADGTLLDGTAGEVLFGVTIEPSKVAESNTDAALAAAVEQDLAVAVYGVVNRDIAEDNLDRSYTAAEVAAFNAAGSKIVLAE